MMYKYCSLAIALFAGAANANPFAAKTSPSNAKAAYHAGLMKNAVPTKNSQIRQLDQLEGDDNNNANQVDLTGYSLKFEKCQFVKSYSQDLAEEGAGTILATDRFVIFRLCPSGSCKNCNSNYGEYMVDMESYLGYTVEYRQDEQDEMCETCQETCNYQGDDNAGDDAAAQGDDQNQEEDNGDEERKLAYYSSSVDCDTCSSACLKIEGMEDNNYLDATNFINCQELENGGDDGTSIYAGPICASQGSKIKIGVFTDEDCMFLDSSKDVEDYLADEDGNQMKLAHALLKTTYDSSDCISCLAEAEGDDDAAAAETKEVCEELYQDSAKCETDHGFAGITSNNYYYENAQNQVDNEDLVCSYIDSIKAGTYSQDGEIVIGGSKVYTKGGTSTTGGQKFALTFFIIGTVGLAVYSAMLHSQLTKGGGKADLSAQGGAMA